MAIPRTDGAGAGPLASVAATRAVTALGDTRQESHDRLLRLEVGKQFQAQILSRFNDGTFLVRIADTTARLALPDGSRPGDGLELTLLGTDPRPTFNLDSQHAAAANLAPGARIAQALYLSTAQGAAGASGAPSADTGAAPATLSPTARMISELLGTARNEGAQAELVGRIPVSLAPGGAAPQLASALHDTLTFSGLFYESHVHQWANGERPLSDLLREPQAAGSTAADTPAGLAQAAQPASPSAEVAEARRNLLDYFSTAQAGSQAADATAALDPAAAQMVNLQLGTLEQQRVLWRGELWPGQPMEWQVNRDKDGGAGTPAKQEHWQSVVRFTLPSLGVVSATINLAGDHVQIHVRTASEDSAAALRRHGPRLASALGAAGSQLDQLSVKREGTGGSGDGDS